MEATDRCYVVWEAWFLEYSTVVPGFVFELLSMELGVPSLMTDFPPAQSFAVLIAMFANVRLN